MYILKLIYINKIKIIIIIIIRNRGVYNSEIHNVSRTQLGLKIIEL